MLEEGGLTDELLLLAHLLTGVAGLGQLHLQGAERGPHHLAVAEVLGEGGGSGGWREEEREERQGQGGKRGRGNVKNNE